MKNTLTLLILLFFAQSGMANSLYDQLCEFNYNWKKYEARAPKGEAIEFQSDEELIQAHLTNVLVILRSNPNEHLNRAQRLSRNHFIEVLEEYKTAGIFPMNYYREERIPVFIDQHNTHCAVGFLLRESGHGDVAKRIASTNNYAWVKEINDPALPSWQEASGFSLEELKLIQGAYDFYVPNAFHAPNKLEIPQKPAVVSANFDRGVLNQLLDQSKDYVWCHGEGKGKVLNGRWEQNYRAGIPWIEGFFEDGARTGQWKEYYKGTDILCRTENWRNDKLNGVRTRFNRQGDIIEKILFKDGNAVLKTNYSLHDSLTYIRKPLDSNLVYTEVYTTGGGLIASGNERIYNPSGLLWFQNIELTALNSAAITARDASSSYEAQIGAAPEQANSRGMVSYGNKPSLVEYHKEGDWIYYQEFNRNKGVAQANSLQQVLARDFRHIGPQLASLLTGFHQIGLDSGYDSLIVRYDANRIKEFIGYGEVDYTHLKLSYHQSNFGNQIVQDPINLQINQQQYIHPFGRRVEIYPQFEIHTPDYLWNRGAVKEIGQMDINNNRIGEWKHYTLFGQLYKTENYLVPWREESDIELLGAQ